MRIIDEFEQISVLRGMLIINDERCDNFSDVRIEEAPRIGAANPPSPRDHLPSIAVVPNEVNPTAHLSEHPFHKMP